VITLQERSALVMLAIPVDALAALASDSKSHNDRALQASDIQARRAQVLAELRKGLVLQADGHDAQITVEDLIVSSQPDPAGHGISQVEWLIQVQWPQVSSPVQRLYLALSIFPPQAPADFAYTVQISHPAQAYSEAVLISPAQPAYTFLTEKPAQTWTAFAQGWLGFWHHTALALLVLAVLATQASLRQAGIRAAALLAGSFAAGWALQGSGWGIPDAWGQAAAAGALVVLCGAWFTQAAGLGLVTFMGRRTAIYEPSRGLYRPGPPSSPEVHFARRRVDRRAHRRVFVGQMKQRSRHFHGKPPIAIERVEPNAGPAFGVVNVSAHI
jgi:hypothetical protein